MNQKDADRTANSVDPDQTAVWSGSALFAQAYLSENLGPLLKFFFFLERNLVSDSNKSCVKSKILKCKNLII